MKTPLRRFLATSASLLATFFIFVSPALAVTDIDSSPYILHALRGTEPDPTTGAFAQSYPLVLPPGRHGVQPSLSLQYSSASTDPASLYGYGWSLSIPAIRRLPLHGPDDLYTRADFTSTFSGELSGMVLSDATHGTFGAKVDDGSLLQYTYATDETWSVKDKMGNTYTFGGSSSARVADPSNSAHVYEWMLTSMQDALGNTMTYTYTTNGNQVYPSTITYTSFGSTAGLFTVSFTTEARTDVSTSYASGFLVTTSSRVKTIAVTENTQTIRSYDFAYTTGDNGTRSLLSSITETATTEDGTSSLAKPATTFTYSDGNSGWSSSSITFPETIAGSGSGSLGVYLFDVNSDAIPDIVKARFGTTRVVYLGNGDGTWTASTISPPIDFSGPVGQDMGVRVMDMDGDGDLDLVYARYFSTGTLDQAIYLNNGDGTGWTASTSTSIPIGFTSDGVNIGVISFDADGDGLADIVKYRDGMSGPEVYINNGDGTGWTLTSGYTVPVPFASSGGYDLGVRPIDVNGDGLTDLVYGRYLGSTFNTAVYLNQGNGTGWVLDASWVAPLVFIVTTSDYGNRPMDVNGDGLIDFVYHRTLSTSEDQSIYLNNGTGWTLTTMTSPLSFTNGSTDFGVRIDDFDADGLPDILKSRDTGSGAVNELYLASGSMADMLTGVITDTGAQTTVTYGSSANGHNSGVPYVVQVATSIVQNDGLENTSTKTYSYTDGDYYAASAYDRRFAGFGTVTATDSEGITKQYFHQGNSTNSTQGESTDSGAKIGKLYREERQDSTGHTYKTTIHSWGSTNLGTSRDFVYNTQDLELLYGSGSTHTDNATTYSYSATTGNLTEQDALGQGTGTDAGAFTDSGTDKRVTIYTYATSSTTLTGFVASKTLQDSTGTTVEKARYTYDSNTDGSVTYGNITKQEAWISGTTYASTTYTYDGYGNLLTSTDPNSHATTNTMDSANLYPATITNALSQAKTVTYNYATGKPKKVTEANGVITQTTYDAFGRPTLEERSSATSTITLETAQTWSYNDSSSPRSTTHRTYFSSTSYAEDITYVDGFNHVVETKTRNEDGTGYTETETDYDALGRVSKTTLPANAISSSYDVHTVASALAETYTYDVLDRPLTVVNALGTTTTSYSGFTKTVTDALSHAKEYTTDGLGRLASVVEHNGTSTYTTSYTWSGADKLTKVTDASSNIRNFTYDGRGLRLTAQDLHASTDTSYATWTYTYDSAGNMATSVSPNAITTTYTYDALNRVTRESPSSAGSAVTYTFDSCTNGTGLPCGSTVTSGATIVYAYNTRGQKSSETTTIGTSGYVSSYTYDIQGNVLTETNPDGTVVTNTYNYLGKIETVQKKGPSESTSTTVISSMSYGPDGQVTVETNGNGTTTTNTYDATKRYQLTRKVTTNTATASTTVTSNFYPSAGDGYVYYNTAAATWATAHDAATGNGAPYTLTYGYSGVNKSGTGTYTILRGFLPFDTSSIPDTATITSAKLKVYVLGKSDGNNDGSDYITVAQGTEASRTTLATSDYSKAGTATLPTEGIDSTERKDLTSVSTGAYLTFTLNTTGQGWVSKTGGTQLALREGHDASNSATSFTNNKNNYLYFDTSEATGTANDPYLEVTYTTAATAATTLQDVSYTYDAVGNITQTVDASATDSRKTTTYAYDDLARLTSAAITGAASGSNTTITYTYNAIGDITYRSDWGTYTYGGSTSTTSTTKYANPHAVTSILKTDGTTQSFTYDTNGNVKTDGTLTMTWDYKNRLLTSKKGTTTTTFTYNAEDERMSKATSGVTTYYPSAAYSIVGTVSTVHINAGALGVATQDTAGSVSTLRTNHLDHLGSTSVVTDSTGAQIQLLDYYPYGGERLHTGTADEQRTFIGQYSDDENSLSYLNARYYDPARGMFVSQDPAFLAFGTGGKTDTLLLLDPQSQNSYLYARGNPMSLIDRDGKSWLSGLGGFAVGFAQGVVIGAACVAIGAAAVTIGAPVAVVGAVGIGLGAVGLVSSGASAVSIHSAYTSGAISADEADRGYGNIIGNVVGGIVGGGAAAGAIGAEASSAATMARGAAVAEGASTVHGNSLSYPGVNYGYTLRDVSTGGVMKFGETIRPESRYSQSWLRSNNLELQIETKGTKSDVHNWQHQQIVNYKDQNGGSRPKLNKSDW